MMRVFTRNFSRIANNTRPVLSEPVHDLIGDQAVPGLLGGVGVKSIALRNVKEGEVVFQETGELSNKNTMHSIQISANLHCAINGEGRFCSHSEDPNCKIQIFSGATHPIDFVAIKDIAAGEEISFNYNTTEWDMDSPFVDHATDKRVAGFSHLSQEERTHLFNQGLLPEHIASLWLGEMLQSQN